MQGDPSENAMLGPRRQLMQPRSQHDKKPVRQFEKYKFPDSALEDEAKNQRLDMTGSQLLPNLLVEIKKREVASLRANDNAAANAWAQIRTKEEFNRMKKNQNDMFVKEFILWLQGRSIYNTRLQKTKNAKNETVLVPCTPWGPKDLLRVPGVAEFLDQGVDKRDHAVRILTKLKLTTPRDVNEAWIYYKYLVRKGLIEGDNIKEVENYGDLFWHEATPEEIEKYGEEAHYRRAPAPHTNEPAPDDTELPDADGNMPPVHLVAPDGKEFYDLNPEFLDYANKALKAIENSEFKKLDELLAPASTVILDKLKPSLYRKARDVINDYINKYGGLGGIIDPGTGMTPNTDFYTQVAGGLANNYDEARRRAEEEQDERQRKRHRRTRRRRKTGYDSDEVPHAQIREVSPPRGRRRRKGMFDDKYLYIGSDDEDDPRDGPGGPGSRRRGRRHKVAVEVESDDDDNERYDRNRRFMDDEEKRRRENHQIAIGLHHIHPSSYDLQQMNTDMETWMDFLEADPTKIDDEDEFKKRVINYMRTGNPRFKGPQRDFNRRKGSKPRHDVNPVQVTRRKDEVDPSMFDIAQDKYVRQRLGDSLVQLFSSLETDVRDRILNDPKTPNNIFAARQNVHAHKNVFRPLQETVNMLKNVDEELGDAITRYENDPNEENLRKMHQTANSMGQKRVARNTQINQDFKNDPLTAQKIQKAFDKAQKQQYQKMSNLLMSTKQELKDSIAEQSVRQKNIEQMIKDKRENIPKGDLGPKILKEIQELEIGDLAKVQKDVSLNKDLLGTVIRYIKDLSSKTPVTEKEMKRYFSAHEDGLKKKLTDQKIEIRDELSRFEKLRQQRETLASKKKPETTVKKKKVKMAQPVVTQEQMDKITETLDGLQKQRIETKQKIQPVQPNNEIIQLKANLQQMETKIDSLQVALKNNPQDINKELRQSYEHLQKQLEKQKDATKAEISYRTVHRDDEDMAPFQRQIMEDYGALRARRKSKPKQRVERRREAKNIEDSVPVERVISEPEQQTLPTVRLTTNVLGYDDDYNEPEPRKIRTKSRAQAEAQRTPVNIRQEEQEQRQIQDPPPRSNEPPPQNIQPRPKQDAPKLAQENVVESEFEDIEIPPMAGKKRGGYVPAIENQDLKYLLGDLGGNDPKTKPAASIETEKEIKQYFDRIEAQDEFLREREVAQHEETRKFFSEKGKNIVYLKNVISEQNKRFDEWRAYMTDNYNINEYDGILDTLRDGVTLVTNAEKELDKNLKSMYNTYHGIEKAYYKSATRAKKLGIDDIAIPEKDDFRKQVTGDTKGLPAIDLDKYTGPGYIYQTKKEFFGNKDIAKKGRRVIDEYETELEEHVDNLSRLDEVILNTGGSAKGRETGRLVRDSLLTWRRRQQHDEDMSGLKDFSVTLIKDMLDKRTQIKDKATLGIIATEIADVYSDIEKFGDLIEEGNKVALQEYNRLVDKMERTNPSIKNPDYFDILNYATMSIIAGHTDVGKGLGTKGMRSANQRKDMGYGMFEKTRTGNLTLMGKAHMTAHAVADTTRYMAGKFENTPGNRQNVLERMDHMLGILNTAALKSGHVYYDKNNELMIDTPDEHDPYDFTGNAIRGAYAMHDKLYDALDANDNFILNNPSEHLERAYQRAGGATIEMGKISGLEKYMLSKQTSEMKRGIERISTRAMHQESLYQKELLTKESKQKARTFFERPQNENEHYSATYNEGKTKEFLQNIENDKRHVVDIAREEVKEKTGLSVHEREDLINYARLKTVSVAQARTEALKKALEQRNLVSKQNLVELENAADMINTQRWDIKKEMKQMKLRNTIHKQTLDEFDKSLQQYIQMTNEQLLNIHNDAITGSGNTQTGSLIHALTKNKEVFSSEKEFSVLNTVAPELMQGGRSAYTEKEGYASKKEEKDLFNADGAEGHHGGKRQITDRDAAIAERDRALDLAEKIGVYNGREIPDKEKAKDAMGNFFTPLMDSTIKVYAKKIGGFIAKQERDQWDLMVNRTITSRIKADRLRKQQEMKRYLLQYASKLTQEVADSMKKQLPSRPKNVGKNLQDYGTERSATIF